MSGATPLQKLENLERLILEHEEWKRRTSEEEMAREARMDKWSNSRMYKVMSLVTIVVPLPSRAPKSRVSIGRRPSTNAHEPRGHSVDQ